MIFLIVFLAVWLLLGYIAARIVVYEQVYFYNRTISVGKWLALFAMILLGPIGILPACLDAEKENIRRGFFLKPYSEPKEHLWFQKFAGFVFRVKED